MALDISREELRADILEITISVVTTVVKENNHRLVRMINEDLTSTNQRIDNLDKTDALIRGHIANPNAHAVS